MSDISNPTLFGPMVTEVMSQIVKYVHANWELIKPHFERQDPGFALTLRNGTPNEYAQCSRLIGAPTEGKELKYVTLSQEKIWRATWKGDASSKDSADHSRDQYAGGIVYKYWAIGISGLAELDDHCLAVAIGVRVGIIPLREIRTYINTDLEERFNKFLMALPINLIVNA